MKCSGLDWLRVGEVCGRIEKKRKWLNLSIPVFLFPRSTNPGSNFVDQILAQWSYWPVLGYGDRLLCVGRFVQYNRVNQRLEEVCGIGTPTFWDEWLISFLYSWAFHVGLHGLSSFIEPIMLSFAVHNASQATRPPSRERNTNTKKRGAKLLYVHRLRVKQ